MASADNLTRLNVEFNVMFPRINLLVGAFCFVHGLLGVSLGDKFQRSHRIGSDNQTRCRTCTKGSDVLFCWLLLHVNRSEAQIAAVRFQDSSPSTEIDSLHANY